MSRQPSSRDADSAAAHRGAWPPVRRHLSQNFLTDAGTRDRILAAFAPTASDRVIEVGPGRGALTLALAPRVMALVAIEIDRALAARLARSLQPFPHAEVRQADILRTPLSTMLPGGKPPRLIANLPYHLSSRFLLQVLDQPETVADLTLLLQREFAERLSAPAGPKEYGSISVLAQARFRITPLFAVPPHAFRPRPSVWSELIRLEPLEPAPIGGSDWPRLKLLLRVAFAARRKTLANALSPLVPDAARRLTALGVDPGTRGERLAVSEWIRLAGALDFLMP